MAKVIDIEKLRIYQYTAPGFDPSTDETDHLVRWVAAESEEVANGVARLAKWHRAGGCIYEPHHHRCKTRQDYLQFGVDVVVA